MYYIFFIHSSVDGRLDCFLVLAVVNSASVNTGVHASFWIMSQTIVYGLQLNQNSKSKKYLMK